MVGSSLSGSQIFHPGGCDTLLDTRTSRTVSAGANRCTGVLVLTTELASGGHRHSRRCRHDIVPVRLATSNWNHRHRLNLTVATEVSRQRLGIHARITYDNSLAHLRLSRNDREQLLFLFSVSAPMIYRVRYRLLYLIDGIFTSVNRQLSRC